MASATWPPPLVRRAKPFATRERVFPDEVASLTVAIGVGAGASIHAVDLTTSAVAAGACELGALTSEAVLGDAVKTLAVCGCRGTACIGLVAGPRALAAPVPKLEVAVVGMGGTACSAFSAVANKADAGAGAADIVVAGRFEAAARSGVDRSSTSSWEKYRLLRS